MPYTPVRLKRWEMPEHYFGAKWPDYYSAGVGQRRDSDALSRSNFTCMLSALGGESDTVHVVRESHWAVGWIEWIAIHESDAKALRVADDIVAALEEYPVINEDHYSELEHEEANEVWRNCYSPRDRIEYIREHRYQFDFHNFRHLLGCVRGEYFCGSASELLS
jgi:hypothetical protein